MNTPEIHRMEVGHLHANKCEAPDCETEHVVLFEEGDLLTFTVCDGNLSFDAVLPLEEAAKLRDALDEQLKQVQHPFGSNGSR